MITSEALTEFFGWCLVINSALIFITFVASLLLKNSVVMKIQSRLFSLSESELTPLYFQYIAQYKLLVLVFNFTPYVALKIIT